MPHRRVKPEKVERVPKLKKIIQKKLLEEHSSRTMGANASHKLAKTKTPRVAKHGARFVPVPDNDYELENKVMAAEERRTGHSAIKRVANLHKRMTKKD